MEMKNESNSQIEFFLYRYRWGFLILFVSLTTIGISIPLIIQQRKAKSIEAIIEFEILEEEYENYTQDYSLYKDHGDTIEQEKMDALINSYKKITHKYPKEVVAQKSFLNIGTIYVISKKYEEALQNFSLAVKNGVISYDTYLTPRALFNVAAMQENTDKPIEAVTTYQRIADEYPKDLLAPHAMYNIARINEQQNKASIEAIGYYQLIINNEDWKDSKWVSIAKDRLALLQKLVSDDKDETTTNTEDSL